MAVRLTVWKTYGPVHSIDRQQEMSLGDRFAVLISKPNQERKAATNLKRQGIEHFLPLMKRRGEIIPLFPRYLFASIESGFFKLLHTVGIQGIINFGYEQPPTLCATVINQIKSRCDHRGIILSDSHFKYGQQVRIQSGPFADRLANITKLTDTGRVQVLTSLFGRQVRLNVNEEDLTAA